MASFIPFFNGFVIEEPVTLDHMHGLGERSAEHVKHRKRPDLDPDRIDHQGVAFIVADRIPVPRRRDVRWMGLIEAHLPIA